jgi:TadE-like protein
MSRRSLTFRRTTSAIRQAIRRFTLGDDGVALIEFTIFAPMLIIMSIYIMDFGLYFFYRLEMQNAAQAGAQWAIATGLYNDSDIQVAAQNATHIPASDIQVIPNEFCGCPSSTGVVLYDPTKPYGICPGGATCVVGTNTEAAGNYVTVTATTVSTYKLFNIAFGFFTKEPDITGKSTVRIQ